MTAAHIAELPITGAERHARGFTLIELIVVIIIISTLATVAIDRLLYWQERAEKAMMESSLEAMKMGLRIHMAELMAANRGGDFSTLERENPMRWLAEPPADYAGEDQPQSKPGWYFVSRDHELVYLPRSSAHLEVLQNADQGLHFRVVLEYATNPVSGTRVPAGVTVVPVTTFKWF
ncbi:MAG TPA: prepilin-type N-terminal cleavage/methylation domain-containing protein [Burkholderiales bacterium]|nr:prepilin-type N-terminal cleavage/methylation domain-containing protein [Burkholderiales bacterium]